VDHGSLKVEVATSPVEVKPDIRIAGHSLKLQVNDDQGQPLTDATALLVSEKQIKVSSPVSDDDELIHPICAHPFSSKTCQSAPKCHWPGAAGRMADGSIPWARTPPVLSFSTAFQPGNIP
jgi:hypothetical protein